MIKPETSIQAIKQRILNYDGKPVTVRLNLGRNKFITFNATLSGIYPSIFTVQPLDSDFVGKTAYSYAEILCGKVFIELRNVADGSN